MPGCRRIPATREQARHRLSGCWVPDTKRQSAVLGRTGKLSKHVLSRWKTDPKGKYSYLYIARGRKQEAFEIFDESIGIANSSIYVQEALGKDDPAGVKLGTEFQQAKQQFETNRRIAIQSGRLPESK